MLPSEKRAGETPAVRNYILGDDGPRNLGRITD